jgi:hypothetical protein
MPTAVVLTENTLGARLTLRREVFELCLLPLAPLLPLLPDSPAALQVRPGAARGGSGDGALGSAARPCGLAVRKQAPCAQRNPVRVADALAAPRSPSSGACWRTRCPPARRPSGAWCPPPPWRTAWA